LNPDDTNNQKRRIIGVIWVQGTNESLSNGACCGIPHLWALTQYIIERYRKNEEVTEFMYLAFILFCATSTPKGESKGLKIKYKCQII